MNLTDDLILKFQKGTPILIDDICAIYCATIGEIVEIGYTTFQQYLSILTSSKPIFYSKDDKEMKELIDNLTDFQYLLLTATLDPEMNTLLKHAFLFFVHEPVTFSLNPEQIIIGPIEEKHILTEEKFHEFQTILRHMYFIDQDDDIIINPDDSPAIKKLKMQMRENREKVKRAKAKQAAKEKSDLKFSDLIGSLTINNCGLNMNNIWNISYYAFHDQLKRMGWRDQFNINNRAALAGAKLKKNELKHWMRSIANSEQS